MRVLEYLGILVPENLQIKIDFIKLSDPLNEEWVKRYHEARTKMGWMFHCGVFGIKVMQAFYRVSSRFKERHRWYKKVIEKIKGI